MENKKNDTSVSNLTIDKLLKNKKINIKPITRHSALGKGHDGEFLFTGAKFTTCLAVDRQKNQLIPILNREEQDIIERELQLKPGDLSFYKKDTPFWVKFRVELDKEGSTLDLSNVMDFLRYRVLLSDKRIAKDWNSRLQSGEYKFALVDEDEETKTTVTRKELNKKAYALFATIDSSASKMRQVILLTGKKTTSNDLDFLSAEIQKMIDSDINNFIRIMEDKNFKIKVFINECVEKRALDRTAKNGYAIKGGADIGKNLEEAIEFLEAPQNNAIKLKLKAQIEEK